MSKSTFKVSSPTLLLPSQSPQNERQRWGGGGDINQTNSSSGGNIGGNKTEYHYHGFGGPDEQYWDDPKSPNRRSSPFNPGPVTIINTGGGDVRQTTVRGNAQYAERDIINNNTQSPEDIAKLLNTLLSDLDLSATSDPDDFNIELSGELRAVPKERQNQIWDWMDCMARDPDTRDEAIKTFAEILGSLFGLPGTVTAGAFKVGYTALTKARRKRQELPADYTNPFDASGTLA